MSARRTLICAVLAASLLAPDAARAQEDVEQAKALFNAGAQAYAATRYQDAVQSFEAAYAKAPRPAILFSLAQAYRRLYVVDQKPESLLAALTNYRRYLELVPQGGRRADAADALSELEVVAARIGLNATPAADPAPAEPSQAKVKLKTRINVTSPTPGARVSLDGGAPVDVPLMADVQPGQHRITITAPGYIDEQREIIAAEGDTVGIDRELRERPARLELKAPPGAQVLLDGRLVGTTPMLAFDVPPGRRFVGITKNGYKAASYELSLRRGDRKVLEVDLERTLQRTSAYGLFVAGGLSAVGGVLTLLGGLGEATQARQLQNQREAQGLTEAEAGRYAEHLDERDRMVGATSVLFGSAAVLGLTGFMFYAFDTPLPPTPPARGEPTPSPEPAPRAPVLDLSARPVLGPGIAGAQLVATF